MMTCCLMFEHITDDIQEYTEGVGFCSACTLTHVTWSGVEYTLPFEEIAQRPKEVRLVPTKLVKGCARKYKLSFGRFLH